MSAKPAKQPKAPPEPRIFVPRGKLSRIYTMTPPSERQRAILATGMVRSWPEVYEMFPTDDVKQVLTELDVAWSDKK